MIRLSLVLMMLFASPVRASVFQSGNSLYKHCIDEESNFGRGYCLAYIAGVNDVMNEDAVSGWKACVPNSVTQGQLQDVVTRWLANNPQDRHYAADNLVAHALSDDMQLQRILS